MSRIVYAIVYLISLLPFRLLYVLSDIGYFFVHDVARYRRKIVRRNLETSFPERNEKEIKKIERKFYHWFCDYFFEAIKLLSISDKELYRRFQVNNVEEVEQCFQEGQDAGGILGHYCNWEWLSTIGAFLPRNRMVGLVYDPLHSKSFDDLFHHLRSSQPNGLPVPKKDILRALVTLRGKGQRSIFGYIADQAPRWTNIHLWLPFLNHQTPVFTGAERIMRKMNNAVFYVKMERPRRGYYTCTFQLITRDPGSLPEYEIIRRFFSLLEQDIQRHPEYYLWTHNHWKRTKEEFDRRFELVNGKVIEKSKVRKSEKTK